MILSNPQKYYCYLLLLTRTMQYKSTVKKIIICSYLVFAVTSLYAQSSKLAEAIKDVSKSTSDSGRVDALAILSFAYAEVNPDSAIYYAREALTLANSIDYNIGIGDSYNNLGWAYYRSSDFAQAETFFTKSIEIFKATRLPIKAKMPLANLATVYMDQAEYAKSLECFMQVLKYEENYGKDNNANALINKAATFHEIGRLYNLMKQPGEAKDYFQQALQISRLAHSDIHIGENLMSIGNTYQSEGDQTKALQYYNECLKYLARSNDFRRIGLTYENKAISYLQFKKYAESIKQFRLAKENYTKINSKTDLFYAAIGIADVYAALKDSVSNLMALNEAISYARELNNKTLQQQVFVSFADFYKVRNNYKMALLYTDSSYAIKDSIFTKDKQQELVKMQTQFETDKKQKEIELLKKDQQLNMASLQRQRIFRFAAYIITALLLLIGFLFFKRYRYVQRIKRTAEMQDMRNNIARDLHDDIGSTLTSINILSDITLQLPTQTDAVSNNLQKIKDRSAGIMEKMNDIVWAINPANDALDKIILRIRDWANEICEQKGIQFIYSQPDEEISDIVLSLKQRSNIYLVFKEALNNGVKYSEATVIKVEVTMAGNDLSLNIIDNGKGFDANTQPGGNGLRNMKSRAAEMNASLKVESVIGEGTRVSINVPVT